MAKKSPELKESYGVGTPNILPPPDFHFGGEVGRTYLDSDAPQFPQPTKAPKGAPNILLILRKTEIVVDFKYDGGGMGKGGEIAMNVNSRKVAGGRLQRSIPIQFSLGEGLDIGMDIGSPIDFTYELPFVYTGKIDHVTIDLKPQSQP